MRVLVAVPLGSAHAPVLESLMNLETGHDLSLAFMIADSNEEAINFTKNLDSKVTGRFNKVFRLIYEDRGWILENLSAARNFALEFARERGFDALWFLDSDVRPPPEALENLLSVNSPIVSGFCKLRVFYIRGEETTYSFSFVRSKEEGFFREYPKEDEPFKVKYVGAACLLIRQPALNDTRLNFNIDKPNCGEDINFCLKAEEAGYEILVHPRVFCIHEDIKMEFSKDDARRLESLGIAYMWINLDTCFWPCLRKVKRKHLWIPRLNPEAVKLMPRSYFEPTEKFILLQTGPFEYTPIFGAKALEAKSPEELIEAIILSPIKPRPLSNFEKLWVIITSCLTFEG